MTRLGSPATESGPGDSGRQAVRGSRLARRRRVLFWVAGGAALLAIGGLIGSSFVKSPQQIAADTAAPPPTATTAKVVSQVLTSSVQMRGVVYPATQYDVYPSAPESDAATAGTGSPAGGSAAGGGSPGAVYISRLDVAAGRTISNGEKLAEIDGEPLFALAGPVPAWRDITPGESGPDVAELQRALASPGYYQGGDTPGFFGTATQDAVSLYYGHLGYTPPATGGVPMTDVIFLPSLPAKVVAVNGAKGQQPGQPFLELAARGSLALTGELPPAYAAQVRPGLKVKIFDEVTGVHAAGTVTDLGTATTLAPTGTIVNVGGASGAAGSAGSTGSGSTGPGSAGPASTGTAGSGNSGSGANPGATPPRSWNCSTSSTPAASRSWSSRTTQEWRPTRAGPWRSATGSCPNGPGPVMPRPGAGLPLPRLTARDAAAEAVAGIVQRPGRAGLTMLGTVLGVGAFVAVLGLTATGAGQISREFTVLEDTTVTVEDNGPANNVAPPGANPAIGFPADADAVADHISGVTAAGVWWPVALPDGTNFSASLALSGTASQTVDLLAASPGAVRAMVPAMVAGSQLSTYENDTAQHVAMIDTSTASALGISPARLPSHPAVFVNGIAYTVVGVYGSAQRVVSGGSAMLIPSRRTTSSSSSAPTSRHSTPGSGSTRPRSPRLSRRFPPCSGRHRPHPTCPGRRGPATMAGTVARPSPRPATPDGRPGVAGGTYPGGTPRHWSGRSAHAYGSVDVVPGGSEGRARPELLRVARSLSQWSMRSSQICPRPASTARMAHILTAQWATLAAATTAKAGLNQACSTPTMPSLRARQHWRTDQKPAKAKADLRMRVTTALASKAIMTRPRCWSDSSW